MRNIKTLFLVMLIIASMGCMVVMADENESVERSDGLNNIIQFISVSRYETGPVGKATFIDICHGTAKMILQKKASDGSWEKANGYTRQFSNVAEYKLSINRTDFSAGTYRWAYQVTAYDSTNRFETKTRYTSAFTVK